VSKDLLNEELKNRTDFILWMQKNDIREYEAVNKMIQLYYRDKEEILNWMYSGRLPDENLIKGIPGVKSLA
jgi:hypothetical protein